MTTTDRPSPLRGARILVVEDDYYLATDLQQALGAQGAVVLGPFNDVAQATSAVATDPPVIALVDVNLGHGPSFDLPRHLIGEKIPFAFVTGYDQGALPSEFRDQPRIEKPASARAIVAMAEQLLAMRSDDQPVTDR